MLNDDYVINTNLIKMRQALAKWQIAIITKEAKDGWCVARLLYWWCVSLSIIGKMSTLIDEYISFDFFVLFLNEYHIVVTKKTRRNLKARRSENENSLHSDKKQKQP